jgi:hypothetical protein
MTGKYFESHTNVSWVAPAYTILSSTVSTRFIRLFSPIERKSAAARSTSDSRSTGRWAGRVLKEKMLMEGALTRKLWHEYGWAWAALTNWRAVMMRMLPARVAASCIWSVPRPWRYGASNRKSRVGSIRTPGTQQEKMLIGI